MTSPKRLGWIAAGLALLASVAGGVLIGEQAGADMDPFYANVASRMPTPRDNAVTIVDADGGKAWIETPDYYNVETQQQDGGAGR